jgi:hypothetical protein
MPQKWQASRKETKQQQKRVNEKKYENKNKFNNKLKSLQYTLTEISHTISF